MSIALFPGQGVQSPGMGSVLVEAAPDVFVTASELTGVDFAELCTDGRSGDADLSVTRWAQPAVLVCGVAAYRVLVERGESFTAACGHSVGEYAALVAAGSLDLADALRLITVRAEATEEAGRAAPGGMAAVMRVDGATVERMCSDHGVALAAENGPGQFVLSGPLTELEAVVAALNEAGAVTRRLDVSAAFHSPVMSAAAPRLTRALGDVAFSAPDLDLWSPTTAGPLRKAEEIRNVLVAQLTSPVRWRETVEGLAERHGTVFCDLGPGRVVAGLTKRIVAAADIRTLDALLVGTAGSG